MVGNDGRYDNPFWEYHLPVNPIPDPDVPWLDGGDPSQLYVYRGPLAVDYRNCYHNGELVYEPRLGVGINGNT